MTQAIKYLKLSTQHLVLSTLFLLLAACSPAASEVLPTAIDLNAISTNDASTRLAQTAVAVDATSTRAAFSTLNAPATLPPTWTPAPQATNPPSQATPIPPTAVAGTGTLYYVFNGDSIAMLTAADKHEELIVTGGAPADLVLSPDNQWLAFTRQTSETVREVFVMSLKTDGVPPDQQLKSQQVSCLGYATIILPTWTADSRILAFAASQTANGPLGIYTVDVSGQCPVGNHQRGLVQTQFKSLSGMTWNINNTQIYFGSGSIYGVDAATGILYPALTQPTGYGPDSYPVYRPDSTTLYYLKTDRDAETTVVGGALAQVDTSQQFTTFPLQELRGTKLIAQQFQFSQDGRYLISSGAQEAFIQDMDTGSAAPIVQNAKFPPQAVLSPDAETVAYVDTGAGPTPIQQIWVVNRRGTDRKQLTNHIEGTISNMNWAAQ